MKSLRSPRSLKWVTLLLLAPCLILASVRAADPADSNQRKAREVVVKMEDGKEVKAKVPAGEFLTKDGVLTLYLGDEVNLEFQDKAGKLVEPKVVAKVEHPERTLTFKMSQEGEAVMMSRTGEIQKAVAMDCQNAVVNSKKLGRTNLEPTEKGLGQFDGWPAGVWMLRLSKIEVSDESAAEIYRKKAAE